MRLIGLYYLETSNHGLYSDLTLEKQRRPRVSCASYALKLRKGVVSWHGLAPMTVILRTRCGGSWGREISKLVGGEHIHVVARANLT